MGHIFVDVGRGVALGLTWGRLSALGVGLGSNSIRAHCASVWDRLGVDSGAMYAELWDNFHGEISSISGWRGINVGTAWGRSEDGLGSVHVLERLCVCVITCAEEHLQMSLLACGRS